MERKLRKAVINLRVVSQDTKFNTLAKSQGIPFNSPLPPQKIWILEDGCKPGAANFVCKRPDNKYFRFCGSV
jgi:hypothetical protein